VDFAVAPVPRLFKQPVVWTMPHQFTFPKRKTADAAKRDAAWAYMRWMSDHVAEWTLKPARSRPCASPHSDPRITSDPVLRTLPRPGAELAGRAATPKWVAAENLTRPVIENVLTSPRSRGRGHAGSGPPDQTPCRLDGPQARGVRRRALTPYLFLAPGLALFVAFRLYPLLDGLAAVLHQCPARPRAVRLRRFANYGRLLDDTRFTSAWSTPRSTPWPARCHPGHPLALAVALNRGASLRTFLRSAFFFPFTLSVVTVGLVWLWLLDPWSGR